MTEEEWINNPTYVLDMDSYIDIPGYEMLPNTTIVSTRTNCIICGEEVESYTLVCDKCKKAIMDIRSNIEG